MSAPATGQHELVNVVRAGYERLPVDSIPMSVRAMKEGAVEFITKPFRDQDLLDALHQALERARAAGTQRVELEALQVMEKLPAGSPSWSGWRIGSPQSRSRLS
jgi:FixJ family two-component response regulator